MPHEHRHHYLGRDLNRALTIEDLRRMAQRALPHFLFEHIDGAGIAKAGAACAGEAGAHRAREILQQELDRCPALLGQLDINQLYESIFFSTVSPARGGPSHE